MLFSPAVSEQFLKSLSSNIPETGNLSLVFNIFTLFFPDFFHILKSIKIFTQRKTTSVGNLLFSFQQ